MVTLGSERVKIQQRCGKPTLVKHLVSCSEHDLQMAGQTDRDVKKSLPTAGQCTFCLGKSHFFPVEIPHVGEMGVS